MRILSATSLIILATLAGGCGGDSTGTGSSFAVTLAVDGTPTQSVTATPTDVTIRCDVKLVATTRNSGSATWADGVMRFYYGADRKVAADSQAISAVDVQGAWGSQIVAQSTPRSDWYFTASRPFDVEVEFRFAGGTPPAKTRFSCGPPPKAASAPTITTFTVTPATGTVKVGATLQIGYVISAPGSLWSTDLKISGPFTFRSVTAENGVASVSRSVRVVVPPGALLGVPLSVNLVATDAEDNQGIRGGATGLTVADDVPPSISDAELEGPTFGGYVPGDTMRLKVTASDNNLLEWLVWQLGTPVNLRDSVRVPAGTTSGILRASILVRPEWVAANPPLSVVVRDAAGYQSNVWNLGAQNIYPVVSHPVTAMATAPLASSRSYSGDAIWDAKRRLFYLTLGQTNDVQVLDEATMTFRAPISLPSPGAGLDLTPSGDSLIVAVPASKSLAVMDLGNPGAPPTSIALTVLDTAGALHLDEPPRPAGVGVAANGVAIVELSAHTLHNDGVLSVNLRTGDQLIRADARTFGFTPVLTMGPTPDRSRIVLYEMRCLYQSASDTISGCIGSSDTKAQPVTRQPSFDAAGQRFSVGSSVENLSFARQGLSGSDVGASALSPDGATIYVAGTQRVTVIRVADFRVLERIPIPFDAQRILMSPDGGWLAAFGTDAAVQAVRVDLR